MSAGKRYIEIVAQDERTDEDFRNPLIELPLRVSPLGHHFHHLFYLLFGRGKHEEMLPGSVANRWYLLHGCLPDPFRNKLV